MPYVNDQTVKEFAQLIQAENLDSDPELSPTEALAVRALMEHHGYQPTQEDFDKKPTLEEFDLKKVREFYDILDMTVAAKQVVFIDTEPFESYYNEHYKPRIGVDFQTWVSSYLEKLEEKFTLEDGPKLNIEFVTVRPTDSEFSTIVLTDKDPYETFQDRPEEEKIKFVVSLLQHSSSTIRTRSQAEFQKLKATLPEGTDPNDISLAMYDSSYVQGLGYMDNRGKITFAKFLPLQRQEFGNPQRTDMVLFYGDRLKGYIESSEELGLKDAAQAFADITAHETGHLLGLYHAGRTKYEEDLSLMGSFGHRPLGAKFGKFHLEVLKHVLGLQGEGEEAEKASNNLNVRHWWDFDQE